MPSRLPECAGWWSEPVVVFPAPGGLAFYEVIAASLPREAVPTADRRQPDPFARPHGFLHAVLSPVVCWGRSRPLRLGETAFFSVDFRASPGQPDLSCVLARGRPRPSGRCGHHASISATG